MKPPLFSALALLSLAPFAHSAVLTTVATTGYTQDIVYEAGLQPADTGKISHSFGARAFFEGGAYGTGSGLTQSGNTGVAGFTSTLGNTVNFNFQPFSGNNVAVASANQTLTLSSAAQYSSLGFVASSTVGSPALATINYTINYTTGLATTGSFTLPNWGDPTPGASTAKNFIEAGGRAQSDFAGQNLEPNSSTPFGSTSNSGGTWHIYLFETAVDTARTVSSVNFSGNASIFGIVGAPIPEPTSSALAAGALGLAMLVRRRK